MFLNKYRSSFLAVIDILILIFADLLFLFTTVFNRDFDKFAINSYIVNSVIIILSVTFFRIITRIYSTVWRYPNTNAYITLVFSDIVAGCLSLGISYFIKNLFDVRHHIYTISVSCLIVLLSRFCYRKFYKYLKFKLGSTKERINVAIVGAGQLGALLGNDLMDNYRSVYRPVFYIDIDNSKIGSKVIGLPVYNEDENILDLIELHKVREIIIALNGISQEKLEKFYDIYHKSGCKIRVYDVPVGDADKAEQGKKVIRDFGIEDLLFRKPIKLGQDINKEFYKGKCVLVTGGGGSIGSELCRQLAATRPSRLVIFDIYENNAYEIQQELIREYGDKLDLSVEIGSVRDRERLEAVFKAYKPQIVFHAAAHKHVPLMEQSCCEAVKNNVFGTYNTADMAEKYGAEKFVLISTDKAVNPTNIMGATKRLCEMVVGSRSESKTVFCAVRFGNVLGSNGSVIPLFKKQISEGGPITITDKRIIRYFMTIPEASQLVMRAGAMARCGELFVLDMGRPVRIYDLAVNMIKLSGFEPETEIEIKEIGLRPGEKLYEELLMKTETLDKTEDDMIFIERDAQKTRQEVDHMLAQLNEALDKDKFKVGTGDIKKTVISLVPTFCEPAIFNETAEESDEMKTTVTV